MPNILLIESTSTICSVAVADEKSILSIRETTDNSHSAVLTQYILDTLDDAGLKPHDLNAVAVSKGPGSYTGLRIGVSAAKGLCYALEIPLIAVDTLKSLAFKAKDVYPNHVICPMIDARRMEVYTALFDVNANYLLNTEAKVVDEVFLNDMKKILDDNKVVFLGSGAEKSMSVIKHHNAVFDNKLNVSAALLAPLSCKMYEEKIFEDLAYFEPFYLKEYIAKKSSVKALNV